jgi:aminoglycoside/choline kinase family phosphotransferase
MIPVGIGDIDTAWLTDALASRLPAGTAIRSFSVETIGTGVGLMGLLYRVTLEYDGDPGDAPASVIVKLPVLLDDTRQVARVYRLYEKEVAFYRQLAVATPLNTPEIYRADHDLDSDDFVLVMQDLGHLRAADQVAGCEREDALAAIAALARHHAAFWNDPRFATPELEWLPFPSDAPTPEGIQQAFDTYWQPFVEFMGDDLHPDVKMAGDWLPGAARELLAVPDGHATTVVHGDFRLDNLFFDDARDVSALDWQIVTQGVGGYDFAYFVSQSLSADDRRAYLDELVETYLTTLASAGIDYPEDQFWFDVRRTVLFCLAYPVQVMALDLTDPRAQALVRELANRSSSAILEMGAMRLVPSGPPA